MKKLAFVLLILFSIQIPSVIADHPEGTVKVDIYGLVCDFCARALEKVFGKEDAVADIEVDLNSKVVTIHLKDGMQLDNSIIEKNIIDSGYSVEEIRRGG